MQSWVAKLRLAWRDLAAQGRRTIFFALLVAAGVASLVGVQGVAGSLVKTMERSAQQMVQGDLVIQQAGRLTTAQQEVLNQLEREGAQLTRVLDAPSMAVVGDKSTLVEVKAVDPAVWPFYGGLETSPADVKLGTGEALVGPELLGSLKLKVGDSIQLGDATLKIVGTVLAEPRALDSAIPMGPRVLVAHESFRAGASLDMQKLLIKLPASIELASAKERLVAAFPGEDAVQTYEEAWRQFAEVMGNVFTFLSMVALISLLVGGLGVAMAMRTFIGQKLEQIALLKALGATAGSVMTIYLIEAALLGLGGSLVGILFGLGVQLLLPKLLADLLPFAAETGLNLAVIFGGLAAGVGTALLCALIPVRAIRNVKPGALFRGESTTRMGWKAWLEALLMAALTLGGVTWLAIIYAKSTLTGAGFIGGLLFAALVLSLLAWVLLRMTRLLPQSGRPAIRHAVRSLRAPGNQSTAVVVAMGLGIMLMTTLYLLQSSLIAQVRNAGIGPETPNLFLMGVTTENRTEMRTYLEAHPEVARVPDPIAMAMTSIESIDGTPIAERGVNDSLRRPFPLMSAEREVPKGMKLVEGEWFSSDDFGKPVVTVNQEYASALGLKVGSQVTLTLRNEPVTFTVKSLINFSGSGVVTMNSGMISAAPGAVDPYASEYLLTVVTKPGQEQLLMADLLRDHPSVMPLSLGVLVDILDDLLAKVTNILRFVTGFAVVAAGVILSGSLSATQLRRRKEAALLKSLGATRGVVALASSLENGLLGMVAGLAGSGLAFLLIKGASVALKLGVAVSWVPLVVAAAFGAVMAVLVGLASTLDALRVKPLGILRGE